MGADADGPASVQLGVRSNVYRGLWLVFVEGGLGLI